MSALSVPVSRTLLKTQDHATAARLGCSVETVRSYRLGKRRVPEHLMADLRRLKIERARQKITEGHRELAALIAEGGAQ